MAFNFGHINAAVIGAADKKPGHSDVVLFAPTADFTDIKVPVGPFAAPGDSKKITTAHTFPVGKGFIELQGKAKSIDGNSGSNGDSGGTVLNYQYKVIVKGDDAVILEFFENIVNEDLVLLFNSPECGVDKYVQLGGRCSAANVSSPAYRSGNRGAGGFKEYEMIFESSDKFFYTGTVTKKP